MKSLFYKNILSGIITAALLGYIGYLFYLTAGRSVWIDEGMLLKSILYDNSYLDFLAPLPFYDQAQPFLASIVIKFIANNISTSIFPVRASILFLSLIVIIPFFAFLYRRYSLGLLVGLLLLLVNINGYVFYYTEIKHYFLEVSATFILVYSLYFFEVKKSYLLSFLLLSIACLIGFSSIIPAGLLLIYYSISLALNHEKIELKKIILLFAPVVSLIVAYLHMKHLAQFQINNYDVYLEKTLLENIKDLIYSTLGAYGSKFFLLTSFIVSFLLLFYRKDYFIAKVNYYLISIYFCVIALKLAGLYPVNSSRHLVWIVPFSMVIIACFTLKLLDENNKIWSVIGYVLLLMISIQGVNIFITNNRNINTEYSANNNLFEVVSNMTSSNILVFPYAQPALDYYITQDEDLRKHRYYGLQEIKSGLTRTQSSIDRLNPRLDIMMKQRPRGEFYLLLSHLDNIYSTKLSTHAALVVAKLNAADCMHKSVYTAKQVQLISVKCKDN